MKYYFVSDSKNKTYLIAAINSENAHRIAKRSKIKVVDLYELQPDTFDNEGFLITGE